ncbi:5-(carboxyamino)imidazole ribonucleotide synthase [Haloferacaceae archaeon DSL9]
MTVTLPGPTLGVVGGGQLGRMLAEAASPLGVEVIVLDPTPDCPAAPVARDQILGDFDDEDAVFELAGRCDALTFEIELADPDLLATVREETGVPVNPDPDTLAMIQDKLVQKEELAHAGSPVPQFVGVGGESDLRRIVDELDRVMLKARRGGYDGRGNVPVSDPDDAATALDDVGGDAMAEIFVPYARELSVIGVKGDGERAVYPVTETVHEEEILRESATPARVSEEIADRAREVALDVLDLLDGRGVYGIELFETDGGDVLVNEIAPRPHNSGHWTIEGARTSQFENHVRAVLGWPLGSTALDAPTVTTNLLGDVSESRPLAGRSAGSGDSAPDATRLRNVDAVLCEPSAHLHWYGKAEVRPLRKMGHVTVTDERDTDLEALLDTARALRDKLTFERD